MKFELKLAVRNLRRHGRRTLITASAIAVGITAFLFIQSMLEGADRASERNLIWYETSSIRIYSPEGATKRDRLSLQYPVQQTAVVLDFLKSQGYVATPRLSFQAELYHSDPESGVASSQAVRATAIDPVSDSRVFPAGEAVLNGKWFSAGQNSIVLGRWLAENIGATLGSTISLSTRSKAGSYQVLDLDVVGILDSPNPTVNRAGAFIPLDLADAQLGMEGNATEIDLALPFGSDTHLAAGKLATQLQASSYQLTVLPWQILAPDFLAMSSSKQKSTSSILFLVFVIAAVGISNTLLMAFYERKTEIGTLRALGMDNRRLFWSFILEAAGIGFIGSLMGMIVGALAILWLVNVGFDYSALIKQMDIGYRISGQFRGVWSGQTFIMALLFGIILPAIWAILPTRRALKMSITDGLRVE